MKIIDYIVLEDRSQETLRDKIVIKAAEGYTLQGGVSTNINEGLVFYFQAMVLYPKDALLNCGPSTSKRP